MAKIDKDTFLYFGFGSNLLKERLQIQNPSAEFKTIGKLDGYKLSFNSHGFNYKSRGWHGAPVNVLESPGEHLWGCVWIMHKNDLDSLDDQEGVSTGIYKPLQVEVETPDGEKLQCRTYQLVNPTWEDPRPSPHYLSVILKGAKQNNLPHYYIDKLSSIEHNGYSGKCEVFDSYLAKIVNS